MRADTGDLYALAVDVNNLDQGLWQDLCSATSNSCATPAPTFANRIDNGALEVDSGSAAITQGSYNLALSAAPAASNGTNLYAGTVNLYRCVISAGSSSCILRNTTNALDGCNAPAQVAPAQHALAAVAPTGTQATTLSGTGVYFTLTATGATSDTLSGSGNSATYPLLLSSLAGLSGNVALTCTGAPTNSTCIVAPSIAPLGRGDVDDLRQRRNRSRRRGARSSCKTVQPGGDQREDTPSSRYCCRLRWSRVAAAIAGWRSSSPLRAHSASSVVVVRAALSPLRRTPAAARPRPTAPTP